MDVYDHRPRAHLIRRRRVSAPHTTDFGRSEAVQSSRSGDLLCTNRATNYCKKIYQPGSVEYDIFRLGILPSEEWTERVEAAAAVVRVPPDENEKKMIYLFSRGDGGEQQMVLREIVDDFFLRLL